MFHYHGAPVDEFLGDQLLLPAAVASQSSQYRVAEVTTNATIIQQFGLLRVKVDEGMVVVVPTPQSPLLGHN
jgi:RNA 3'-terminal phosphate cyclase (ATP)